MNVEKKITHDILSKPVLLVGYEIWILKKANGGRICL